jgi:hypothetical protein
VVALVVVTTLDPETQVVQAVVAAVNQQPLVVQEIHHLHHHHRETMAQLLEIPVAAVAVVLVRLEFKLLAKVALVHLHFHHGVQQQEQGKMYRALIIMQVVVVQTILPHTAVVVHLQAQ